MANLTAEHWRRGFSFLDDIKLWRLRQPPKPKPESRIVKIDTAPQNLSEKETFAERCQVLLDELKQVGISGSTLCNHIRKLQATIQTVKTDTLPLEILNEWATLQGETTDAVKAVQLEQSPKSRLLRQISSTFTGNHQPLRP